MASYISDIELVELIILHKGSANRLPKRSSKGISNANNLIILINNQLLFDDVSILNRTGAKGR
jgi:hypothetical protein